MSCAFFRGKGEGDALANIVEFRREVVLYEFHLCKERGDYNSWRYAFYHGLNRLKDEDINILVADILGVRPAF